MNQRPLKTLFIWTIWAATALICYLTLYRGNDIWVFVERDASRISWLILGLFGFGVVASFLLSLSITLEAIVAQRVDETVAGKGLKALGGLGRKRRVARFFEDLKLTTETNNATPDVETLLTSELGIYQRFSHTLDVIGTLLITLALVGTVVGLTMVLTGLTGSLNALGYDQEMMLSGLRKAMSGMGTAFYTTLLGIVLGGVLLRVFAQITEHGVSSVYDNVMRTCMVHCAADLQPSAQRDLHFLDSQVEALSIRVKALQLAFKASKEAMSDFREEAIQLREVSRQENAILLENLRMHRHNVEMMRDEVKEMKRLNKPWWVRLREALWAPKS